LGLFAATGIAGMVVCRTVAKPAEATGDLMKNN
jgi:hypothetical protein